jgi:hypothetical protein
MVTQLQRGGVSITLDQVLAEAVDADSVGRPHVAKALVRSGIVPDVDSAFRLHLKPGKAGYVPQIYTTPEKAIATIRAVGGIAVLAHPGRLKDRAIIDALAPRGLQGLEVFYPLHDEDDVAVFRKKAAEYGLVMTAGMDFHDIRYHTKGVGMEVAEADLEPFFKLVGLS